MMKTSEGKDGERGVERRGVTGLDARPLRALGAFHTDT